MNQKIKFIFHFFLQWTQFVDEAVEVIGHANDLEEVEVIDRKVMMEIEHFHDTTKGLQDGDVGFIYSFFDEVEEVSRVESRRLYNHLKDRVEQFTAIHLQRTQMNKQQLESSMDADEQQQLETEAIQCAVK